MVLTETVISKEARSRFNREVPSISMKGNDQGIEKEIILDDSREGNHHPCTRSYEIESGGTCGDFYCENRYRAIFENSMDNIYLCDARTGKIIESNRSMQRLLGYSEEELLNMTAFDFLDHTRDNVESMIGRIRETGHLKLRDRRYRRKDGSLVDIEATCVLLREKGEDLLCVVSRDITERIEYEELLLEERNRAEFYLDVLCHDIGNLHQGIVGFVKLLKQFENDPQRARSFIENIDALAMRSVNLSNNLKILAGMEVDTPIMEDIDPEKVIRSCIGSVRSSLPWKDPVFNIDIDTTRKINSNHNIEYAFYNVIHNAVKYQLTDRPVVEIHGQETREGYLRLSITDRGCGIPSSLHSEILNRDSLNKKHGGLGLLVVRSLVERSGGFVRVKEPDETCGTEVIIELPLSNLKTGGGGGDDRWKDPPSGPRNRNISLPLNNI